MRYCICLIVFFLCIGGTSGVLAVENKGPEQMSLDGGDRGPVPFPHHRHQNALKDCKACHDLFPQERGSIEKLKAEGRLPQKEVMNKLCIKCHKAEKRAGNTAGPITCSQCHVRK